MANCDVTVTVTFKEEGKTEDKEKPMKQKKLIKQKKPQHLKPLLSLMSAKAIGSTKA